MQPSLPHTHRSTQGGTYTLSSKDKEAYLDEGYIRLPGVLTEDEVLELERVFDAFVEGKMDVPGKDFCDMSQAVRWRGEQGGRVRVGRACCLSESCF